MKIDNGEFLGPQKQLYENTKEIENSDNNFGEKIQLGSTIVEEQRINKDDEI